MPFDGGKRLMCSGCNRRIKRRRPRLNSFLFFFFFLSLGEKAVLGDNFIAPHAVGRGANSGEGFKKKICPVRAALVGPPIEPRGPADHSLEVCDLPLALLSLPLLRTDGRLGPLGKKMPF